MPGQITKRVSKATGKASWRVQLKAGETPEGKTRWLIKTYAKERDAKAFVNAELQRRAEGIVIEPTKITLGEYLDRWLKEAASMQLRGNTKQSYETILKLYVRPKLGDELLARLTPLHFQALYAGMQEKKLSARTVRYTHSVLNTALKQATRWRLLAHNPAQDAKLPKVEHTEMKVLTRDEVPRFLAEARKTDLGPLFQFAVDTGMRPSEVLGLQWEDVDLDRQTVTIQRTLTSTKDGWTFEQPKTKRSRRTIPITAQTVAALRFEKSRQAELRIKVADIWRDHGLVFSNEIGEPLNPHGLFHRFKTLVKRAGLADDLRLYDLRHTCATLLLQAGINPKVVSERLGHASIILTLNTYSHVLPDMQQAATEKLAEVFGNGGSWGVTPAKGVTNG